MSPSSFAWSDEWRFGFRIWLEKSGQAVLGLGRAELLAAIDRTNSISAAARSMGMSYRHAWVLIQEINERGDVPLVDAAVGGKHGGGARLTNYGRQAVAFFQSLQEKLANRASQALREVVEAPGRSDCVHVLAAVSLQEVVGRILAEYAVRHPSTIVRAVYGASNELADHVLAGMTADLFLSADETQVDRLLHAELAEPKTRQILATSGLVVLAGPHLSLCPTKPADLLRREIRRVILADPDCPLGTISRRYLQRVGVYDSLLPRVVHVDNSRAVIAALNAGRADVGLAFSHETAAIERHRILFCMRGPHDRAQYVGAVLSDSVRRTAATELLKFLRSAEARRHFRRCGFRVDGTRSNSRSARSKHQTARR